MLPISWAVVMRLPRGIFDSISFIQANDQMMKAEDIADGIIYCLKTPAGLLPAELELRALQPKK